MQELYTTVVKSAKVAARNILRMKKVNKWITRKMATEAEKKSFNESMNTEIEKREKACVKVEFEAEDLNPQHPEKEERVKAAEELREETDKRNKEEKERLEKQNEVFEKKLEDIDTAITEWSEGKRLVSKDELKTLTEELITEHVKHDFKNTSMTTAKTQ